MVITEAFLIDHHSNRGHKTNCETNEFTTLTNSISFRSHGFASALTNNAKTLDFYTPNLAGYVLYNAASFKNWFPTDSSSGLMLLYVHRDHKDY